MNRVILGILTLTTLISHVTFNDLGRTEPTDTVTISFAGDCTLGSFKGSSNSFGNYWNSNSPDYFLGGVKDIFTNDDITFVNLEGPLTTHKQELVKEFSMRGEPEYIEILKQGSVEIVNLSNNHIYDCGQTGFIDTVTLCQQNGINTLGEEYISGYSVNNVTVYFLGYKGWSDTIELRNKIAEDIKVCKEVYLADIVCVEFHWGEERKYYPNNTQKSLAHWTIDSGADVVVGAHPHVLQGIEKYNNKIIAYSLGNFCFGGNSNPKDKDTMILQVTLDKSGSYTNVNVIPCTVSSTDSTNDFRPTVQSDTDRGNYILQRIREYSSGFDETYTF